MILLLFFVCFDFFSLLVSHILWQSLISPLIETLDKLVTLFLEYSSSKLKFVTFHNRATSPKFIIKLTKIDVFYFEYVQSICTHDTRLNGNKQNKFFPLKLCQFLHLVHAVNLAVPCWIFELVSQVMALSDYFLRGLLRLPGNENAAYWHLFNLNGLFCLFHRYFHVWANFLLSETI